jgi:hypothetical protein
VVRPRWRSWLAELPEPVQHAVENLRRRREIALAGQLWFFQAHIVEESELEGPVIPGAGLTAG